MLDMTSVLDVLRRQWFVHMGNIVGISRDHHKMVEVPMAVLCDRLCRHQPELVYVFGAGEAEDVQALKMRLKQAEAARAAAEADTGQAAAAWDAEAAGLRKAAAAAVCQAKEAEALLLEAEQRNETLLQERQVCIAYCLTARHCSENRGCSMEVCFQCVQQLMQHPADCHVPSP